MGETVHKEAIYVAVNQDVRESTSTLLWTLKTFPTRRKLCLLHIHLPFSLTASSCGGFDESEINAIKESEVKSARNSLHKYRDICTDRGVNEEDVEISLISGDGVGEEIVKFIYQNNIKKLIMGAAADPHYSRGMSITSRKAEYVSQHAPRRCKMWFICKGKLIKTRGGSMEVGNPSDSNGYTSKGRRRNEYETKPLKEHHSGLAVSTSKKVRKEKGNDSSPCPDSDKLKPPEDYFCPITMEIMRDPHVAADGHTYEGEEIRKWLSGGSQISPKTGSRLPNHNLTPNYTLRSLINDWLHHHPNYIID